MMDPNLLGDIMDAEEIIKETAENAELVVVYVSEWVQHIHFSFLSHPPDIDE